MSVLIPVYNEEEIIEKAIDTLRHWLQKEGVPFELLVVDNGSTDATFEVARRIAGVHQDVRVFHIDHRTVGGAFWTAVDNASFDWLMTIDADLSVDLSFLLDAYKLLNQYDLVVGSKVAGSQDRSWIRKAGSCLYINIARRLMGIPATDYSIGAKAYRRSAIACYRGQTSGWTGYTIELLSLAKRDGLSISEVAVRCIDTRASHFNIWYEGIYRYWHLFRLLLRLRHPKNSRGAQ